jgi:hypothetical protein
LARIAAVGQCSCHLAKTTTDLTLTQTGSELPLVPIATYPVDRGNQILLTASHLVRLLQSCNRAHKTKESEKKF